MKRLHTFFARGRFAIAFAPVFVLCTIGAAAAGELPIVAAPPGFTSTDRRDGGRILSGPIVHATSGYAAFREAMHVTRAYFDAAPRLVGGITSTDGTLTILIFDAAVRRAAVRGLVVARYRAGSASVRYLFDEPSRLARTLPGMEAEIADSGPKPSASSTLDARWLAAGSRIGSVALTSLAFPDGSASVGVATGFEPHPLGGGEFYAVGPAGTFMRLDHQVAFVDPSMVGPITASLPRLAYTPDVTTAWTVGRALMLERTGAPAEHLTLDRALPPSQGANGIRNQMLFGTADENGRHLAYMTSVETFAPTRGIWQMTFSVLWAAPDRIDADAPKMLAMFSSYRGDRAVQSAQVASFNATFNRTEQAFTNGQLGEMAASRAANARASNALMERSAEAQTWISQSGQSSINSIAGNVTVFMGSGHHQTIPIDRSDGFVPVPIDQYQKGVDY